jgi:hypothetical protein
MGGGRRMWLGRTLRRRRRIGTAAGRRPRPAPTNRRRAAGDSGGSAGICWEGGLAGSPAPERRAPARGPPSRPPPRLGVARRVAVEQLHAGRVGEAAVAVHYEGHVLGHRLARQQQLEQPPHGQPHCCGRPGVARPCPPRGRAARAAGQPPPASASARSKERPSPGPAASGVQLRGWADGRCGGNAGAPPPPRRSRCRSRAAAQWPFQEHSSATQGGTGDKRA